MEGPSYYRSKNPNTFHCGKRRNCIQAKGLKVTELSSTFNNTLQHDAEQLLVTELCGLQPLVVLHPVHRDDEVRHLPHVVWVQGHLQLNPRVQVTQRSLSLLKDSEQEIFSSTHQMLDFMDVAIATLWVRVRC